MGCKKIKPAKVKPEAPKTKRRRFPKNKGGKAESAMFQALDALFPNQPFINNGYYSFMLSPSNSPLQLDRYYPAFNLAFEYDGRQHDEYIKYIHKARTNFIYQQVCDKIKDKKCIEHGVTLIRISHKDKLTLDLIRERILESNRDLYRQMFGG
jgi:hypothetical protein